MSRPEPAAPPGAGPARDAAVGGALAQAVAAAFDDQGPLTQAAEGFRLRDGQTRLALALILHGRKAMAEFFTVAGELARLPAVVFHGWGGSVVEARSFIDRGVRS